MKVNMLEISSQIYSFTHCYAKDTHKMIFEGYKVLELILNTQ